MSLLDTTNALFIMMGFIVFVSSRTASQYSKGHNISVTRLRYSTNHNALDRPIRACLASQNDELFENQRISEKLGIEEQQ